jgi:hypothetical protein
MTFFMRFGVLIINFFGTLKKKNGVIIYVCC